jgi:hypothetical protein
MMARGCQQRRHSDGEEGAATGRCTGLAAGDFQNLKGSALALSGVASSPKRDMARIAKSSVIRSFLNIDERSMTKRNREDWATSLQLAKKAKRAPDMARLPPQRPQQQETSGNKGRISCMAD